jgi:hypothetical protein
MRTWILLVVCALLAFNPTAAAAQVAAPVLEELVIQVWPEYDQPAALVIYDFRVAQSALPVTLQIRVPKDGNIFAVAQSTSEGLMNVPYEPPVTIGEYDVVTLTLTDPTMYRVEYYAPLVRSGATLRQYTLKWPGDYAVSELKMFVQKPVGAQNLSTLPAMPEMPGADGFIYAQQVFNNLPAGQPFSVAIEYEKEDDLLSIASRPVSTAGGLESAQGSTFSLSAALPWIAGGLGLALVIGGLTWYWQSGRTTSGAREARRKRHVARAAPPESEHVYCSQCGKRAEESDRFCRACGARLRRE